MATAAACRRPPRECRAARRAAACPPARACRRRRAGTPGMSRAPAGKDPNREATASRSAARLRCCQSGARRPARRRGSSSARPATSRNFAAKIALPPSCWSTSDSTASGDGTNRSAAGGSSMSGTRTTNPSSLHIVSTSMPSSRRKRATTARHHGIRTLPPSGESTHTRQSPSSSRQRSTTIVRSSGTAPVAATWSARYCRRFSAATRSRSCVRISRSMAAAAGTSRELACQPADGKAQLARPPGRVALPERHLPGLARRGRHQHAVVRDLLDPPGRTPRAETSRPRATRRPSPRRVRRHGPCRSWRRPGRRRTGRGRGSCPRWRRPRASAPSRAESVWPTRSHVTRGRSSANSSDG